MQFTAEMIAGMLNGEIVGDKNAAVSTVSSIDGGKAGSLAYLTNPKYEQYIYTTEASIVLVDKTFEPKEEVKATLIKVENVGECVLNLLEMYNATRPQKSGISKMASINEDASVGEGCYIGDFAVVERGAKLGNKVQIYPQCYIGDNVEIGEGTKLYPGVKVYEGCKIGQRCIIHSGAVIGSDGFGFAPNAKGEYDKIPQIGIVTIEDDVEIGANTTIDRATMGSTVIAKGAKLDNLVQIGHNVVVGENTVMAGQSAVAGSAKVGKNCMIGGQAGVVGHITVGDRSVVASSSGATNSLPEGSQVMGTYGIDVRRFRRVNAVYRNLPELQQTVNQLKKEVEALKK